MILMLLLQEKETIQILLHGKEEKGMTQVQLRLNLLQKGESLLHGAGKEMIRIHFRRDLL